jgi:small-conductance mechanosensitive channel
MMIVAIAWIYVVAMMSIAETSLVAGIMTFLMYCVLPLTIILYILDAPRRKKKIAKALADRMMQQQPETTVAVLPPDGAHPVPAPHEDNP